MTKAEVFDMVIACDGDATIEYIACWDAYCITYKDGFYTPYVDRLVRMLRKNSTSTQYFFGSRLYIPGIGEIYLKEKEC